MIYLMDSGTCAKEFENPWSTHKTNLGIGRILSRGNNSGSLQVVAKTIFSRGQTTVKFFFYKLETKKKIFSSFTFQGVQSKALRHPVRTTMKTRILCTSTTNHARPAIS